MKIFHHVNITSYFCVLFGSGMAKSLYAITALALALSSCASSYNIQGSSNVPTLDGRMLFLKAYDGEDMSDVDSCDIIHGKFQFRGALDSIKIVTLFMDDMSLVPVVLENGEISIRLDNTQQRVSGTPLNEKLFDFIERYSQLESEYGDLGHMQTQAIMDGDDLGAVNQRIVELAGEIAEREDALVTSFIVENFDNVLGPGVFFMVTASHRYPELSPWIEDIMSKATDNFKNDPYVRDYYMKAQQNQAIMNGTAFTSDDGGYQVPAAVALPNQDDSLGTPDGEE